MSKPCPDDPVEITLVRSLDAVTPETWDGLANPPGLPFDPFLSHAFLSALEESGSATVDSGWAPLHLVMKQAGTVTGVVPLYLKSHSYGEYIFDHGWANAFERAGGTYYPKLLSAVPFTPATGRRLLAGAGEDRAVRERQLVAGLTAAAQDLKVSSLHVNFPPEHQWTLFGGLGFLQRTDQQFHWANRDYANFDGFLDDLASRKRKALRKERAAARDSGVTIEWVTGDDLREEHWDAFFTFYTDTGARKWGTPYLTRPFFSLIGERLAEHILLVLCRREGRAIAGALNFIGGETLFGRHWGAIEHHPFLHFEACYYQAIDFAIARGLKTVEAGAQGAHKIARGYAPTPTYSAHWIANKGFREAVADYLEAERAAVADDISALSAHTPFRKGGD